MNEKWFRYLKTDKERKITSVLLMALAVFLVLLLGELAFRLSESAIMQNYTAACKVALLNSDRVLDMNLRSILEVVRGYLNDEDLKEVLKKGENRNSTFPADSRKILETTAKRLALQEAWVNDIIFMDLYGNHYMLSNTRGSYEFDVYYNTHDYRQEDWCEKAVEAMGKEVFFGKNVLGPDLGNILCMAKYMIDPDTGKPIGYLAVTLSRSLISKSYVGGGSSEPPIHFLVQEEEETIYYDGPEEDRGRIREAYLKWKGGSRFPGALAFLDVINGTTNWRLVNVAETRELFRQSRILRNIVWLTGGVILFIGIGFFRLLLSNQRLAEHLMATKLNEREAELLLLQSQINPHFLYNTLDALYFQAIIHGDDQIADTTMALSNHFRLTLNNGSKYITIGDSLKWIREYMKIMNVRFHDRFLLVEEVDESLLDCRILTFIFQPFVENAMNHGLEAKIGRGMISIGVRKDAEDLILEIGDDGAGMEDVSVWESGYGVQNVQERIRLHYGESYGATVKSVRGGGTKVTVRLPLEKGLLKG